MGSLTLVIKPTNACNLRCKYCYVDPNAENGNMSLSVLEKVISGALSVPGKENVRFIWHGGEPLLMGVDFYREVVGMQKKNNIPCVGVAFWLGLHCVGPAFCVENRVI
jgi:uncharacterized protein